GCVIAGGPGVFPGSAAAGRWPGRRPPGRACRTCFRLCSARGWPPRGWPARHVRPAADHPAGARATVAAAASCRTSGLPIAAAAAVTLGAIELLVGLLQALFQFLSRGLMDTRAERQWRCADGVLDVRTLCAQLLQAVRHLGGG